MRACITFPFNTLAMLRPFACLVLWPMHSRLCSIVSRFDLSRDFNGRTGLRNISYLVSLLSFLIFKRLETFDKETIWIRECEHWENVHQWRKIRSKWLKGAFDTTVSTADDANVKRHSISLRSLNFRIEKLFLHLILIRKITPNASMSSVCKAPASRNRMPNFHDQSKALMLLWNYCISVVIARRVDNFWSLHTDLSTVCVK